MRKNSLYTQRLRILRWLRKEKSLTTFQARNELGIMHPSGRIMELRREGYKILTYWSPENDLLGKIHRIARYVLLAGRNTGGSHDT